MGRGVGRERRGQLLREPRVGELKVGETRGVPITSVNACYFLSELISGEFIVLFCVGSNLGLVSDQFLLAIVNDSNIYIFNFPGCYSSHTLCKNYAGLVLRRCLVPPAFS